MYGCCYQSVFNLEYTFFSQKHFKKKSTYCIFVQANFVYLEMGVGLDPVVHEPDFVLEFCSQWCLGDHVVPEIETGSTAFKSSTLILVLSSP